MVDICGETLNIGDLVSARYEQLTRIGKVLEFTKTKVVVGFDTTANGVTSDADLIPVKLAPFNLTKLINQSVGLQSYYQYHK